MRLSELFFTASPLSLLIHLLVKFMGEKLTLGLLQQFDTLIYTPRKAQTLHVLYKSQSKTHMYLFLVKQVAAWITWNVELDKGQSREGL